MSDLTELLERVEKADGPDRGLDGRIAWALGWRFNGGLEPTDHDWDEWPDCAGCWHQPGDAFPDINNKTEYRKGFAEGRWDDPPTWTASIDAGLALVERKLPGASVCLVSSDSGWLFDLPFHRVETEAPTAPLAILAALLRALIDQQAKP